MRNNLRSAAWVVALCISFAMIGCSNDEDSGDDMGLNETVQGRLQSGDETLKTGEYFDRYQVTVNENGTLDVDMHSDDVDSYLMLFEESETHSSSPISIAENDDSGTGAGAHIYMSMTPGVYVIIATSYEPGEEGYYDLTTQFVSEAQATSW